MDTNNAIKAGELLPANDWRVLAISKFGTWGKGTTLAEAVRNAGGSFSLASLKRHDWVICACSDPDCSVDGCGYINYSSGHIVINITDTIRGAGITSHTSYIIKGE